MYTTHLSLLLRVYNKTVYFMYSFFLLFMQNEVRIDSENIYQKQNITGALTSCSSVSVMLFIMH